MPMAASVASSAEPAEGDQRQRDAGDRAAGPTTAPMLMIAWPAIQAVTAEDASRTNGVGAPVGDAHAGVDEHGEQHSTVSVPSRPSSSPTMAKT
jgi:hypothetical protein